MSHYNDDLDTYLIERLSQLTTMPRDSLKASSGREQYCMQIAGLINEQEVAQAVSLTPFQRLYEWIGIILYPHIRKEHYSMFTAITTVLVAVTMLFGGAGATVFAAQASQPDDFLYPVKTFSEDAQLMLTRNPQRQLDMLMTFTDRRIAEITLQQAAGEPVQETMMARFEHELYHMFRIAHGMEDPLMIQTLEQIATHVRKHEREMEQLHVKQPGQADPLMEQVREMLRTRIHLAELGLKDPGAFRNQLQQFLRAGFGPIDQGGDVKPDGGNGSGPAPLDDQPCLDCPKDEGSGFGPGPFNQGEETNPEEGYGPQDPQECNGCQEEGGNGDGGPGTNSTNQGEKPPANKPQEQNSESKGNQSDGGYNQNGGQSNTNSRSGSSK